MIDAGPSHRAPEIGIARPWHPEPGAISISRAEALHYLGYRGQELNVELAGRIEAIIDDLEHRCTPRGAWALFPIGMPLRTDDGMPQVPLEGAAVTLSGFDILRHLRGARYAAVLACTLGIENERRLRTAAVQQPLEGAVLDAACSAYVEAAVSALDGHVAELAARCGFSTNRRYSPGYGDLPLSTQPCLLAATNATRLAGITATAGNLLLPSKSVTALIGWFDGEVADANDGPRCSCCPARGGCPFLAHGETCLARRP